MKLVHDFYRLIVLLDKTIRFFFNRGDVVLTVFLSRHPSHFIVIVPLVSFDNSIRNKFLDRYGFLTSLVSDLHFYTHLLIQFYIKVIRYVSYLKGFRQTYQQLWNKLVGLMSVSCFDPIITSNAS
jgi:hypothetical protein